MGLTGRKARPKKGQTMTRKHAHNTAPSKHSIHYGQPRVNLRGVPERAGTSATISLLCEGEHFCSECGGRIDGLAVYLTEERKHLRSGFEDIGLLHPECFDGEAS